MSMVESFVPGRIRLRSPLLRDADSAAMLQGALGSVPGVSEARLNPVTASLLLTYDAGLLTLDRLAPLLPLLDQVQALEREAPSAERLAKLRALLVRALSAVL